GLLELGARQVRDLGDLAQRLDRDRTRAYEPQPSARRVDDRRGDPARCGAAVEVDRDRGAELLVRLGRGGRGWAPAEVRARDRERAGALQERERRGVVGLAQRDRAVRVTEVPRERGLRVEDDRQAAGPETGRERTRLGRDVTRKTVERAQPAHEHGRRLVTAASLRGE